MINKSKLEKIEIRKHTVDFTNPIRIIPEIIRQKSENLSYKELEKNAILSWSAPDFIEYNSSEKIFRISAIVFAVSAIASFWFKNYLFGLILAFALLGLYIRYRRKPRNLKIFLTGQGFLIDSSLYEFQELESFWIDYRPPQIKELILRTKKIIEPKLSLLLENIDPVQLRQELMKYLPEKEEKDNLLDIFAKLLHL